MEKVQVEHTHQQEGSGNENPGEQHGAFKLQTQVLQAAQMKKKKRNESKNMRLELTFFFEVSEESLRCKCLKLIQ